MARIYSIATQKGGTGKTSTSISISACLARYGKRVLLIDIDYQANASKVLLPDYQAQIKKEDTLYRTILERQPLPTNLPWLSTSSEAAILASNDGWRKVTGVTRDPNRTRDVSAAATASAVHVSSASRLRWWGDSR